MCVESMGVFESEMSTMPVADMDGKAIERELVNALTSSCYAPRALQVCVQAGFMDNKDTGSLSSKDVVWIESVLQWVEVKYTGTWKVIYKVTGATLTAVLSTSNIKSILIISSFWVINIADNLYLYQNFTQVKILTTTTTHILCCPIKGSITLSTTAQTTSPSIIQKN